MAGRDGRFQLEVFVGEVGFQARVRQAQPQPRVNGGLIIRDMEGKDDP